MKLFPILLASVAMVASAACNAEKDASSTPVAAAPVKPVAPPQGGDWSEVVSETPEGGFVMGNPAAAVKLVEYGSMTCPHCADFQKEAEEALIAKYVETGQVSFEFRNFVRDPYDVTASLIARCGGASSFFGLTRGLFSEQKNWTGKLQTVSPEQQQALMALPPARQFGEIAKLAGFSQWAAQRGLPSAKSAACLADESAVNKLVQINGDATAKYDIPGTPSFLINGSLVKDTANWTQLEPKLKAAIGG